MLVSWLVSQASVVYSKDRTQFQCNALRMRSTFGVYLNVIYRNKGMVLCTSKIVYPNKL